MQNMKLFLVVDGYGTKYWVGADTGDEAVAFVEEDIRRDLEDETLDDALDSLEVQELDASKEEIFDEDEEKLITFQQLFDQNEGLRGLIACSEWS